jgi:hypothetical protein
MATVMQKRKSTPRKAAPGNTPIDSRQKAIAEEEEKLRAQMEKYQRLIEDAPKLAAERARARREEFVTRAARTEARGRPRAALPDRRYELNVGAPARQRRLRAEKNEGRTTFFVLLPIFGLVVAWLYFFVLK